MACYKKGSCGVYENRSCSECPASNPAYLTGIIGTFKPTAVDLLLRIDRAELQSLGFNDFPDSDTLSAAIHEAIRLADSKIQHRSS